MTQHYHINLLWSQMDDCWIADVPDLRGCSAHGDPVPEPRNRPAIYALRAA